MFIEKEDLLSRFLNRAIIYDASPFNARSVLVLVRETANSRRHIIYLISWS